MNYPTKPYATATTPNVATNATPTATLGHKIHIPQQRIHKYLDRSHPLPKLIDPLISKDLRIGHGVPRIQDIGCPRSRWWI